MLFEYLLRHGQTVDKNRKNLLDKSYILQDFVDSSALFKFKYPRDLRGKTVFSFNVNNKKLAQKLVEEARAEGLDLYLKSDGVVTGYITFQSSAKAIQKLVKFLGQFQVGHSTKL